MLNIPSSRSMKRAAILAVAFGSVFISSIQHAAAQDLQGAGSTFINPIMQNWIQAYQKATGISINYQSIGSGGGISALISKTVDFAGSDAPMSASEMSSAGAPVLHLPAVIGTECVAYNIPNSTTGMRMSGPVLADIFLGKITYWDDPAIAALGNVNMPHQRIFVAHRSDGSGTTYIFSDYLSKVSPDWKSQVGTGKSLHWPVGLGSKGNEGVSGLLKTHPYSIGYVELAYATQNSIESCVMKNAAGKWVAPSAQSGSIAAAGVTIPPDMRVSITNTSNPGGYPITGFSWLITYVQPAHADQVKKFLSWVITSGQDYTGALQYAPVPEGVRKREQTMIDSIH